MRRYLIGEVCAALGLKPHILRYWEQQVGILSPAKNRAGRRVYTPADVQTLFRVKYLVQERRFTLEGAAQRILEESSGKAADAKARIQQVRQDLLDALGRIRANDSLLAAAQSMRATEGGGAPRAGPTVNRAPANSGSDQGTGSGASRGGNTAGHAAPRLRPDGPEGAPELEWFQPGFPRRTEGERAQLRRAERLWMATARIRSLIRSFAARGAVDAAGGRRLRCRQFTGDERSGAGGRDAAAVGKDAGAGAPAGHAPGAGESPLTVQLLVFQRRAPTAQAAPAAQASEAARPSPTREAAPRPASAELAHREAAAISANLEERYGLPSEVRPVAVDKSRLLPIPHLGEEEEPVLLRDCRLSLYWSPRLTVLQAAQLDDPRQVLLMVPEEEIVESSAEGFARLLLGSAAGHDAVALAYASPASGALRTTGAVAVRAGALPTIISRLVPRVYAKTVEQLIPGAEQDDIRRMEVLEYRVTPTCILRAAEHPAVVPTEPTAVLPTEIDFGSGRGSPGGGATA